MIATDALTKRYGRTRAVDELSFTVRPGRVTGFLGPNGAGKSTTLRMILGLDTPTNGRATIGGRPYRTLGRPLHEVGALLDARGAHPGRTAAHHLRWVARSNGIGRRRADAVLEEVGLASVADRRAGTFSLGMAQRLGIATALLGDPGVLVLDEPINGLDTDGIRWIRGLLRSLARDGRTVLLSSHVMSEMELTADHLVVIARGRLVADAPIAEVVAGRSEAAVLVRSPDDRLPDLLRAAGASVAARDGDRGRADGWRVTGIGVETVGALAAEHRLPLHELTVERASLEEVFTELTRDGGDHRSAPSTLVGSGER